jgi:hypothetical protein
LSNRAARGFHARVLHASSARPARLARYPQVPAASAQPAVSPPPQGSSCTVSQTT